MNGRQEFPLGLVLLLVAAAGFYVWSRTERGSAAVSKAVQWVADNLLHLRGFRNNNPGNIKWNAKINWKGQVGKDAAGFVVFVDMPHGVRAIGRDLSTDYSQGQNTVAKLISEWSETDRAPYIANVSKALNVRADAPIDVPALLPELAAAIIRQENGVQPFSMQQLRDWVYLV